MSSSAIEQMIKNAIATVAPDSGGIGPDTPLTGHNASLDSVGFVTFLVTLEGALNHQIDLSEAFMAEGTSETPGPFQTVATLTDYIAARIQVRP